MRGKGGVFNQRLIDAAGIIALRFRQHRLRAAVDEHGAVAVQQKFRDVLHAFLRLTRAGGQNLVQQRLCARLRWERAEGRRFHQRPQHGAFDVPPARHSVDAEHRQPHAARFQFPHDKILILRRMEQLPKGAQVFFQRRGQFFHDHASLFPDSTLLIMEKKGVGYV